MSTISNKFFVQILEDGSSLHGQLLSLNTLTQAYKNGQCIPDWSVNTSGNARPLIYLSLLNGSTTVAPDANFVWKYNGKEIHFSSTTTTRYIGSTNYTGYLSVDYNGDGLGGSFLKTTYGTNNAPALGIVDNLATADNTDIDVISFVGSVPLTSNSVDFAADIAVTITQWTSGGYLGVVSFPNGNLIFNKGDSVTAYASLYNDSGPVGDSSFTCKWYFEGTLAPIAQNVKNVTIHEADITDYAVLRCDFYMTIDGVSTLVYSAFGSIDDLQDPEYMWIKSNQQNGNSTSLRKGENITFTMSVGTADNDAPITSWNYFKVKLLDSNNNVIMATNSQYDDSVFKKVPDTNTGYRELSTTYTATAKVYFDDVKDLSNKGLTGIVVAEERTNV